MAGPWEKYAIPATPAAPPTGPWAKYANSDSPPDGAVPGSKAYADWAMAQARAGKPLPQYSKVPEAAVPKPDGLMDKAFAAAGSFIEGVPVAGPTLLNLAKDARGAVQGMTPEQVTAEFQAAKEANPISSTIGGVAGTVLPLAALGTVPGVSTVMGTTGGLASQSLFGAGSGAAISAADTLARGGKPEDAGLNALAGAAVGGIAPSLFAGVGKIFGALTGRNTPKAITNVARALKDDQVDPTAAAAQIANLGPDGMVMDLGPNLQAQAGALAATPGVGQTTIRDAIAARGAPEAKSARINADVADTVGQGPDLDLLKKQIIADQKAAADPLYDGVRDTPVPMQGPFRFVLQTPLGKEAFRKAAVLAANDGKPVNNGLTIGLVDYAKQALDDMAAVAKRAGNNNDARQAAGMAKLLRSEADKIEPAYRLAREAYAGPAGVMDAIDAGASVFSKDITPAQLERSLSSMSSGERLAFLDGARSHIESQLGNAVNDALSLRNMFRKGWNEQKLRVVLGDDVADDLMKRINREVAFSKTANAVEGNSETARRLASMGEVAPAGKSLSQVSILGAVLGAVNKAKQSISGYGQKKVNAQMASMLTSGALSPATVRRLQSALGPKAPALIAPGAVADTSAVEEKRQPIELLVTGGNPALSARP